MRFWYWLSAISFVLWVASFFFKGGQETDLNLYSLVSYALGKIESLEEKL